MKTIRTRLAVTLCAALLAGAAFAQPPAQPAASDNLVADLVVRAYGGPPWWVVSDGDTRVYILGIPDGLPKGVTFDADALNKRLVGANEVILPFGYRGPGLMMRSAITRLNNDINHNTKTRLEPSLSPDLRARFVAAREKAGFPETRYGALPPGLAGMALQGDLSLKWEAAHPSESGVNIVGVVYEAARARRVKVSNAKIYPGPRPDEWRKPGLDCLTGSLDEIDRFYRFQNESADMEETATRAWADGDIRPWLDVLNQETPTVHFRMGHLSPNGDRFRIVASAPACLKAIPSAAGAETAYRDDTVAAIARALKKPGHAIAVVNGNLLLMKGGVLDQLRRRGFVIITPDKVGFD